MAFDAQMFGSGLGGLFGGLFGNSGKPYSDAAKEYQKWIDQATGVQKPFYDAGVGAVGHYQNWLDNQKDPATFVNNLVKNYQQSPYTTYLQQQAANAGTNAASASGLIGSTPYMQAQQQNATNIAQQGLDTWLQNVLGVNTQYGQGQHNLITGGQGAANSLTNTYGQNANAQGQAKYGQTAGKQQDFWNTVGGGLGILGSFL